MDFKFYSLHAFFCLCLGIDLENVGFGNGGKMTEVKLVRDDLKDDFTTE